MVIVPADRVTAIGPGDPAMAIGPVDQATTIVPADPVIDRAKVAAVSSGGLAIGRDVPVIGPIGPIVRTIGPIAIRIGTSGRIGDNNRWTNVNNNWNNNWHNNWNNYDRWFGGNWWNNSPNWRFNNNFNYWGWATWPAVTSWFPWGWSQPVYYNYGNNVYYQDDMVYYGDTPVATAADYAYQAEQIATSVPDDAAAGRFVDAAGRVCDHAGRRRRRRDPTMFLQLAVSKEGVIAGTLQNTVSGTTKNVEGMVDKETQRAAWTEVGQTRPIMETGIGNLTQDTASVLVHYADDTTQQWLLVRMDAPPKDAAERPVLRGSTPPQGRLAARSQSGDRCAPNCAGATSCH